MNYRGALVVRVDAIRVLGEQRVLMTLSRQPSALNSTESMPTAFKSRVVILGGGQASPGFPPSCADLSAECKLQPRAVAVKFHIKVQIHT